MIDFWSMAFVPYTLIGLVFLNRYFWGLLLKRIRQNSGDTQGPSQVRPTVCVIVPLFNEGKIVYDTIQCLLDQSYDPDKLSVIVVDDCSKDDSYNWAQKAAVENRRVTVMKNDVNSGKRRSINRAVRATSAEIIISVDSDAHIDRLAIEKLVQGFNAPEVAAVGGRVHVLNANQNWLTKMQTIKYFFGYEYLKNIENSFSKVLCLSGCITAYRKRVLDELEPILENRNILGVPIKYGEDRFLTRQIVKAGYKTKLDSTAICFTKVPDTLSKLFSQQLRWRRSNIVDYIGGINHVWKLHPFVALHYFSLAALLITYPAFIISSLLFGDFFASSSMHFGLLAIYGMIYWHGSSDLPKAYRVHPVHFLWMGIVMPVTYIVLTALAAFTLDSDSWETRSHQAVAPPLTEKKSDDVVSEAPAAQAQPA